MMSLQFDSKEQDTHEQSEYRCQTIEHSCHCTAKSCFCQCKHESRDTIAGEYDKRYSKDFSFRKRNPRDQKNWYEGNCTQCNPHRAYLNGSKMNKSFFNKDK